MEIKKFSDYNSINEDVKIPTLDVVIDNEGMVHNNEFRLPLLKANIRQEREFYIDDNDIKRQRTVLSEIVGMDGNSYPAGIDKNGKLVAVYNDGRRIYNSPEKTQPIRVPKSILDKYPRMNKFWDMNSDYSHLVPILPTGWVNVKIDMEVLKRVRRYSKNLGTNNRGYNSFVSKLSEIEKISSRLTSRGSTLRKRETIQKEMSAIILLHYINEIKDFFTPGSSGFLFESFLGGLIPNGKVIEDNSSTDVLADGKKYQIKLYNPLGEYINVGKLEEDYYLIALKYPDRIDIYLFENSSDEINAPENNIRNFWVKSGIKVKQITTSPVFNGPDQQFKFTLELINIENKIDFIAKGLKDTLKSLYSELSQFQYNIETIISGVDQNGILSGQKFIEVSDDARKNAESMKLELEKLITSISRNDSTGQLSLF